MTKVIIVQNSFSAIENQKNLKYLNIYLDCKALVTPGTGKWADGKVAVNEKHIIWCKAICVKGQKIYFNFMKPLLAFSPDVIVLDGHPWNYHIFQIFVLAKCLFPKIRLIISIKKNTFVYRNFLSFYFRKTVFSFVDKFITGYIAASNMTSSLLQKIGATKAIKSCVHLGVDLSIFRPPSRRYCSSSSTINIGFCGKFLPRKGILELVEAVKLIDQSRPGLVSLSLLGAGPLGELLKKKSEEDSWLKVYPNVPHSKVPEFLQSCDLFAFPSRIEEDHQEHDAHALMEAMAVGLPSVTTSTGIISEITSERTSIYVEPENIDSLKKGIEYLLDNLEIAQKMGREAHKYAVNNFGLKVVAQAKAKIILDLIGKSSFYYK